VRGRPAASAGEEEAWALRIPGEILRDPGVKVVILRDYPYNLPAMFTIKCEGVEATIYREPARKGLRAEEFIEELRRLINLDVQVGRPFIIAITRPGPDPWARKRIYLERAVELISQLARSPALMKKIRSVIVVPEETIFYKDLAGDLRRMLNEAGIEFQEYVVEVPNEEVLEAARRAGIEKPEEIIHLLRAFPRTLRHLKRGKAIPEAIRIELGPEGEDLHYIAEAAEMFLRASRRLREEEVRGITGPGGRGWMKLQTLRALGLVG